MPSNKATELTIRANALADMADDWVAMGTDNITVNDLRERAGKFRQKSREMTVETTHADASKEIS